MLRALPAGYNAGDTIYCYFPAYDSNGASVTITGLAVTDIEVYKNGSTTQRASDNGFALLDTDGIDFDASTGLHGFSVDTSDNSDAGFWADGAHYLIWVDAVTIDSQTVRFGFEFRLGVLLRPATDGRKLSVESDGDLTKVNTLDGHTPQTGDSYARLGAPAGASIAADIAKNQTDLNTVIADTNELQSDWTDGGRLDLLFDAVKAVTDAIPDSGAMTSIATAAALATVDTNVDAILVDTGTTLPATLTAIQGATFDTATDSLEAIRNRGDAAWPTATGFSTHSAADVRTEIDNNSTQLATIVQDTNELQTDLTNGGRLDLLIDAIKAVTDAQGGDGSGLSAIPKTGFKLAADGLDSVVIETGLNGRQALSVIAAATTGVLAGAATATVTIAAAGVPATNRITATVDASGNRSAVTLSPPS